MEIEAGSVYTLEVTYVPSGLVKTVFYTAVKKLAANPESWSCVNYYVFVKSAPNVIIKESELIEGKIRLSDIIEPGAECNCPTLLNGHHNSCKFKG